jgi:hypothetical protein
MRSLLRNKRLVLLLAVLALGALTVLAISLNGVPFHEAQRYAREEAELPSFATAELPQVLVEVPFWKQLLFLGSLVLLIILIGLLLSPEARKRMFVMLIRMAFTFWAIYYFVKNYGVNFLGFQTAGPDAGPDSTGEMPPMPQFIPPQVSPVFSYLISFAFALLWLAVLWVLYRGWKKYQDSKNSKPLDEIARIARSSLDDLTSGRNSTDVIINCYLRMSEVVSNTRQLQREIAMTPREFALRLERAGLPGDAVGRLTGLFEGVRYGDRKSGPKDVNEAVSCLKTILHYCGEPV